MASLRFQEPSGQVMTNVADPPGTPFPQATITSV
jgi:hypothetical protein